MMNQNQLRVLPWTVLTAVVAGCEKPPDQRILDLTEDALRVQSRQNQLAAEQQQQFAAATKELVAADAQARTEVLELSRELQAERREIGTQRDALERERRDLAYLRNFDPVTAAAISALGMRPACCRWWSACTCCRLSMAQHRRKKSSLRCWLKSWSPRRGTGWHRRLTSHSRERSQLPGLTRRRNNLVAHCRDQDPS